MKKMFVPVLILVVVVGVILVGCKATRGGYESAPYSVVRSDGKFELRDYPELTVVETPMAQPGSGADGSFNRLFGFITGRNEAKQKIAMTTPVFMSGNGSNTTMAFVMPARLGAAEVPKPADESVRVRQLEPGRFAVFRFSGGRNPENETEARADCRPGCKRKGSARCRPRFMATLTRRGLRPSCAAARSCFARRQAGHEP